MSAPTIATRAASTTTFSAPRAASASTSSKAPTASRSPWSATPQGKLEPATWEHALRVAAGKLKEIRDTRGGAAIGVIGSNRTTNEENYLLQKFARTVLQTNNIDHERTTDYAAFARALAGHPGKTASLRDIASACAILLIGGNPTDEHPLLAWLLRTNVRLNRARLYVANSQAHQARAPGQSHARSQARRLRQTSPPLSTAGETDFSKAILAEESLVVIFGEEFRGEAVENLVAWGLKRGNVHFAYLGDHSNSRGAADMGLFPDLLPGYVPVTAPGAFAEYPNLPAAPGKSLPQMLEAAAAGDLGALLVVGANPVSRAKLDPAALKQHLPHRAGSFPHRNRRARRCRSSRRQPLRKIRHRHQHLRRRATRSQSRRPRRRQTRLRNPRPPRRSHGRRRQDAGSLRQHAGTTADLGQSRGAQSGEADRHSVWLEANGLEPKLSPFDPLAALDEIDRLVPGYTLDRINLFAGNDVHTEPAAALPDSFPSPRSPLRISSCPRTTLSSPQERWAVTAAALKQLEQHQAKN